MLHESHTKQLQNRYKAVLAFKPAAESAVQTLREPARGAFGMVWQRPREAEGPRGAGRAALGAGAARRGNAAVPELEKSPSASREEGSQSPGGEGQ